MGDPHTFTVPYKLCKCRHVWVYHTVHLSLPWQTQTIFMVDFHTTYINMCGRSPYMHSTLHNVQMQTRMGIPHCTPEFIMANIDDFHGQLPYHIHKYVWEIPIHSQYLTYCANADTYEYTTLYTGVYHGRHIRFSWSTSIPHT